MTNDEKTHGASLAEGATARSASDSAAAIARHTEGPWVIVARGTDMNPSWTVGTFDAYVAGTLGGNDEANAHLIAAAPELLEALKALVGLANETIDGLGHRYSFDYNSPLGKQARAALAKAEGRQP